MVIDMVDLSAGGYRFCKCLSGGLRCFGGEVLRPGFLVARGRRTHVDCRRFGTGVVEVEHTFPTSPVASPVSSIFGIMGLAWPKTSGINTLFKERTNTSV